MEAVALSVARLPAITDAFDDADPAALREQVQSAIQGGGTLWLTDRRGRQVGVSAEKLAYVGSGRG